MTKKLSVFLLVGLAFIACRRKTYSSTTSVPDPVYSEDYYPAPDNVTNSSTAAAPVQNVNYQPEPSPSYADQGNQQVDPSYYDHAEDQEFYDELAPYGDWVSDPDYGYVWIPNAGPDFRPYYSGGHWVYTNYGWTWASDYNWGWAAFHYGSWQFSPRWGWTWIPGRVWAPAWVTWGYYNNSYGWAPMGPYAPGGWNNYRPHRSHWCFVNPAYMNNPNWRGHQNYYPDVVINNVTIINNYNNSAGGNRPYNRGPQTKDVERYTKRPIRAVEVTNAGRPSRDQVSSNRVTMYRPEIKNTSAGTPVRPTRVATYEELKDKNRLPANSTPPTERPARPGNATTPATQTRPSQPANNDNKPSRPATDPVAPTRPTQPTTEPAKPTRPSTTVPGNERPTQPTTQPSRPSTDPVAPTRPTQPTTKPSQPSRPPQSSTRPGTVAPATKPAETVKPTTAPSRPAQTNSKPATRPASEEVKSQPAARPQSNTPAPERPKSNKESSKNEVNKSTSKPGQMSNRPTSTSKPKSAPAKDADPKSKTIPSRNKGGG